MNNIKLFVFLTYLLFSGDANAKTFKVCHVSSAVGSLLPRANDQSILFGGFEIAIDQFIKKNKLPNKSIEFISYQNPIESVAVLDGLSHADKDGCDLIVGLITSKDALIAGPFLVNHKLFAITSTATNDGISKYHSNLLSFSTSASSYVEHFAQWAKDKALKNSEIAVVFKPTEVYSLFFKDEIQKKLPNSVVINLEDLKNGQTLNSRLKTTKAIMVATYPLESLMILKEIKNVLQKRIKEIVIFGTQSWTEVQAFLINPALLDEYKGIFMFSPWDFRKETAELKAFKSNYKAKYKITPDHDSVYDFDALTYALDCSLTIKNKAISSINLKECFEVPHSFSGATGQYNFDAQTAHPTRKDFLFDYREYLKMRSSR